MKSEQVGMRHLWLSVMLLAALSGCSKPVPAPPPPSPDTAQSVAQQGKTAQDAAVKLYQQKAYAKARSQALLAAGLLKLDGSDPKSERAMRLLAAKAGARLKDPAALDELHTLAHKGALDKEGQQLAVDLERTLPHKHAPSGPLNPPPQRQVEAPASGAASCGGNDAQAAQRAHDIIQSHKAWQGQ